MIIYTYPKYSNNDDNKYYKFLMKLKRKKNVNLDCGSFSWENLFVLILTATPNNRFNQ